MTNKMKVAMLGVVVVIIGLVIAIAAAIPSSEGTSEPTRESGNVRGESSADAPLSELEILDEEIGEMLQKGVSKAKLTKNYAPKGTVTYENSFAAAELPDIDKSYPIVLEPQNKQLVVEIFSSPEKAGTGTDGWMLELAKKFNSSDHKVNGKSVGIRLRSISSGTQIDYILANVNVPQAISPSAYLWCEMLESQGIDIEVISDRTVGNVAGVLIDQAHYTELEEKYGTVDIKAIVDATAEGILTTGYTNPFVSTTGLNFLASALNNFDSSNILSNTAIEGFNSFQNNVPFVAYNTLQMRTAAENGTFTCMIMEYQSYCQDVTLMSNYKFIPFGVRHDNPLVAVGNITDEERQALQLFADHCRSAEATDLANGYGFNQMDDYKGELSNISGSSWTQMQKLWKTNKNTSRPIAAVFVLDTSGSMSGPPLNALKASLSNSMKYISSTNYIGVVTYASEVNVALEIGQFDINQQAYFMGAVDGLFAGGNTCTYSALSEALIMLRDFMEEEPNVSPMVFLLSDGMANGGAEFSAVRDAIAGTQIPVYTIGYNADLEELKTISEINEATTINADNDDVIYQLKNLFNANL